MGGTEIDEGYLCIIGNVKSAAMLPLVLDG